ncbi:MAG: hypothetical protein AUH84_07525 [Thaumarchaeota archaeon 13_1_40CM_4_38_7]|nr:MAG: hypothetical protein AUH84_07525 [Thaumarchaeota archaeon 13_1_40CM_4_38_7]
MQTEKLAVNSDISLFDTEPDSRLYHYKIQLDKVKDELMKFGLSSNQAKVYIYLSKSGPKKASDIFKALELPRTETYGILNALQSRGIITAEFSSPVVYAALDLKDTIDALVSAEKEKINILAKREDKLMEMWNEIPASITEGNTTRKEQLQMLQGNPQIHSKLRQMVETVKEEIKIFCTLRDLSSFYYSDIIDMLAKSPADVKLIIIPASITEGNTTRKEQLQMLQGNPQIHSKLRQMVETVKEEIKIFCTLRDLSSFYYSDIIDMLAKSPADVKLIISPASMIPTYARKINKRRIRFMPNTKTENQCFVVKDSEVMIFLRNATHSPSNVFSIWTDSQTLAESMIMLFDCCWEKTEQTR